ncbi:MAG: VWA domain-containing protein [Clostridia bacterium]|nr:VWA domain-containing protein [Clostridia bacterium]
MRNISFDNPYWLLIAIPLAVALLVPYFISVSKDNRTKGWVASLIIHIVMILFVALSAAGLVHTTVMTRTKVYVLADVSYSSNRNFDEIDEYIRQIEDRLPSKSMMGVICFGKDTEILTSAGGEIRSVSEARVDDGGTDIAKALDFTANLFGEGEIKRIVLITDGFATTEEGATAAAVERTAAKGIRIDAIYLDNNLRDGEAEVQISDASYTGATYLNHDSTLDILIESSVPNDVILNLFVKREGESEYIKIDTSVLKADAGMNIASFDLPTHTSGVFDYRVEMTATADTSPYNNTYNLTQTVAGQRSVLLITEKRSDVNEIKALYGDSVTIDDRIIPSERIPYTIEDLVKYDEIILSNVDIRKIENIYAFINSVDLAVSQYGKSLITLGDLSMQNQDDERFAMLEELLPVKFGNYNKDSKLYTIVIDISRSMYHNLPKQLIIAKEAATKLVSILEDDDYVAFVTLAGETKVELIPTRVGDCREELYTMIQSVEPTQGTFVGASLNMAYELMKDMDFEEKQVMLISDGKQYANEPIKAIDMAQKMKDEDIALSTISVLTHSGNPSAHTEGCRLLKQLAEIGGGVNYDFLDENKLSELIFADIADNLTESVVEKQSKVNIVIRRDATVEGILSLPDIEGYVNSKPKLDATMVLSVNYQKSATSVKEVPLYSYREHGNGRVASFTSSLSGDWLDGWSDSVKRSLFDNILSTNTPKEYINYPFNVFVDYKGDASSIEIIPSSVNPKAKASIKLTGPDGSVQEGEMKFDLNRYFASFATPEEGRYHVEITYTYGNHSFTSDTYFTLPYSEEYNSFVAYDIVNIYDFMRGVGQISRDGKINLENDKNQVDTYELSFRIPLLIAVAVLFVVDVVVRKFKWKDIKGLFAKKKKEGAAK